MFTKNVYISPPHQPPRNKTIPLCKYGDLYHLYLGAIVPRSRPTAPYTATEGVFQVCSVLQAPPPPMALCRNAMIYNVSLLFTMLIANLSLSSQIFVWHHIV